jgi:hypothetical protein
MGNDNLHFIVVGLTARTAHLQPHPLLLLLYLPLKLEEALVVVVMVGRVVVVVELLVCIIMNFLLKSQSIYTFSTTTKTNKRQKETNPSILFNKEYIFNPKLKVSNE